MPDPLVTVTAYSGPADARVAKGALDSAGIESLVDEAQERRVKVRVEHVDAIRAGDVLTARGATQGEIEEADEEEKDLACPACGSAETGSSRRALMFALIAVMAVAIGAAFGLAQAAFFAVAIAGVFLLITGRRRCNMCGETWD